MTLVLGIAGRDSIWLLADRQLSRNGKSTKDDAVKIITLQRGDDLGLLGYAGLGATAKGIEPSEWMHNLLHDRKDTFEESLLILAEAIKKNVPRHLLTVPYLDAAAHVVLAPAFVNNTAKLYSIRLDLKRDSSDHVVAAHSHITGDPPKPARIGVAGTGAVPLLKDRKRLFRLQRLVARHERNWDTVSAFAIADQLAALNAEVAAKVATVGPRSIVMWRYREDSAMRRTNGGGHQFYSGKVRERDSGSIPISVNGIDVSGLAKAMMPLLLKQARERNASFDQRAMDEAITKLNEKRDDKLR